MVPDAVDVSPALLTPARLRELEIRNRIWLAPMCQYMVEEQDGIPTDWHLVHLGARAAGGFGLIVTEATAVSPEGRISPQDTGLWNHAQTTAWRRITGFCQDQGARIAVQLAHAGRKASTWPALPRFRGRRGTVPEFAAGWRSVGPTSDPFPGLDAPDALSRADIAGVVEDFVAATRRAEEAGFDAVELHFAHGYLVHEFLSPLVNTRTDDYGGHGPGRRRLALEIAAAVREQWPAERPVIVRLSATDWIDGGWDIEQSVELAREARGERDRRPARLHRGCGDRRYRRGPRLPGRLRPHPAGGCDDAGGRRRPHHRTSRRPGGAGAR